MERKIEIGKVYKHFKGHIYKVIALGKDSEDLSLKVVYQNTLNGDVWIRNYDEFNSKVDSTKYPNVSQEYRFEEIHDN